MYKRGTNIISHFNEHATIYIFMIILFLTGIIFGAILVNSMSFAQKQDLIFYLERFFGRISNEQSIDKVTILKDSFLYHIKFLLILFLLGLSVIGLPVVWVLLFIKGLVVGFTVGFMVNQLQFQGFLLATVSIAPQNIVIIPIYIIAGSLSMIFSISLLNKLFTRKISQTTLQPFAMYISAFLVLIAFSLSAALIEAYVANEAMEAMIRSVYSEE
ncbi:stage II sporulation protein M [Ornithinibacillus halophilus]|uniref:Stage II sporulation protein M n=1 Tax=Ornithinibacillus halophilus TaxID=930117 RepID=A0A1M5CUV4_9BACI|nr:stage II sporulation protein M [Ornithinibacillus halophilus]SHF58530.1 stage II sporulation protein M [Ornithinibacillus halophilus]